MRSGGQGEANLTAYGWTRPPDLHMINSQTQGGNTAIRRANLLMESIRQHTRLRCALRVHSVQTRSTRKPHAPPHILQTWLVLWCNSGTP